MYNEEDSLFSVPVNNRDQNEITLFFMSIDIGVTSNSPYFMNVGVDFFMFNAYFKNFN